MTVMVLGAAAVLPARAQNMNFDRGGAQAIPSMIVGMKAKAAKMASASGQATPAGMIDVESLKSHLDALTKDIQNHRRKVMRELNEGIQKCSSNPALASAAGMECLNLEEQFKDDYAKYVTRIKALSEFSHFFFGDAKWAGIYPSLDFTHAVKMLDSLTVAIVYSDDMPSRQDLHGYHHRFYMPSEQEGAAWQGDLDNIRKLADQERTFRKFINESYIRNACGKNHILPTTFGSNCGVIEDLDAQLGGY